MDTVLIPAGGMAVILPAESGKVFVGHVTARGSAAAPNDPNRYDFQGELQGVNVHLTAPAAAGITHQAATRDQNADFVLETLEIHNFSNLAPPLGVGAPGYDITVTFGVSFERRPVD